MQAINPNLTAFLGPPVMTTWSVYTCLASCSSHYFCEFSCVVFQFMRC